ncbi:hypothetical protein K458DRAFT_305980, partial [Lentithecium fluviatile CBS 122367]
SNIANRTVVITLKLISKINKEITFITSVLKRIINLIYARAIERGFNPSAYLLKV